MISRLVEISKEHSKQRPVVWIGEPDGFCNDAKRILETHADVIYQKVNADQLSEVLDACDAFFFRLGLKIHEYDLKNSQRCKIIATPVTGLDHIDITACQAKGIKLISLKGEFEFLKEVRATAEHTFALLLALIRNIVPASQQLLQNKYNRDSFRGQELYEKVMGIIGFGRLGKIVAAIAKSFGMRVVIFEKDVDKISGETAFEFINLKELLNQSDYISLHVDANTENNDLVNESFLSQMKQTAYLINTSRGSLIDETALVNALKHGRIAGAALDVVHGEPDIDFENELFTYYRNHSNLLITPHLGGNTYESFEKTECFIAHKIIDQLFHA